MLRLGVDLGGTKIEIIAMGDGGKVLLRRREPTPMDNYEGILRTIVQLVRDSERELCLQGTVGIGTPGAISKATGLLKNSNSICLNGRPILQDLVLLLDREVRIGNDANCFALSEAVDGSGAGQAVVFGVIVGTGTGAGIVVDGRVLSGANGIAGEWGHNPLPWPEANELFGPDCYCGKRGCIETYLSGPGLTATFGRLGGGSMTPQEIAAGAAEGNVLCERAMREYENRMARSIAHVINILDPDVIVLGGGMSNIARLYENVPRRWKEYVFSDRIDTKLLPPRHGDSSGVRGAAWLWS